MVARLHVRNEYNKDSSALPIGVVRPLKRLNYLRNLSRY